MKDSHFDSFYNLLLEATVGKLNTFLRTLYEDTDALCDQFADGIKEELQKICIRTLIVEFEVCSKSGRLRGETISQKLKDYQENVLSQKEYMDFLFQTYPELKKGYEQAILRQVHFAKEVLERLVTDKKRIEEELLGGKKFSGITRISMGKGDLHCGGKSVLEIELDCGETIFYKPHPLHSDLLFYRMMDRLEAVSGSITAKKLLEAENTRTKSCYKNLYRCISTETHGWVKKIEYKECDSEEAIRRFYRRIGSMIGISYFLGSHDFHYQNLIAYGEFPVLVDLEAIFETDQPVFRMDREDRLNYSVLMSGLLPGSMEESNLCAVTGGQNRNFHYKVPQVIVDEDGIRIANVDVKMEKGNNIPKIQNFAGDGKQKMLPEKIADLPENTAARHENDILAGFRQAYDYAKTGGFDDLTESINDIHTRHLLRSTQIYQMILSASWHPSLLMEEGKREAYIRRMCGNRTGSEIEVADLLAGDVPYFNRKAGSRTLMSGDRIAAAEYFRETVRESLTKRKQEMCDSDRELQSRLIRMSLQLGQIRTKDLENTAYDGAAVKIGMNAKTHISPASFQSPTQQPANAPIPWLTLAQREADRIASAALWDESHQHVTWMVLKCVSKSSTLGSCRINRYLYEGTAGIAIFLRKMNQLTGGYEELCEAVEKELFVYTDSVAEGKRTPETRYTGLFEGESSLAFAYQLLYRMTGEKRYLDYAAKQLDIVMGLVGEDKSYDLTYGNAGALAALCLMYEMTEEPDYLEKAVYTEQILRSHAIEENGGIHWPAEGGINWGVAHGNAGILISYSMLIRHLNRSHTLRAILTHENAQWKKQPNGSRELPSWCRGRLGVLAACLFAEEQCGGFCSDLLHETIDRADEILGSVVLRKGMCLCHGNMGNLLLMKYCCEKTGIDNNTVKLMEQQTAALLQADRLPSESGNFGLMGGAAGIGLGCIV